MKTKIFTIILIPIVFLISWTSQVWADTLSTSIYPPVSHITIQPGRGTTIEFKVKNSGDPSPFTLKFQPFSPADELGGTQMIDCTRVRVKACEASRWLTRQNDQTGSSDGIFLNTNQSESLTYRLFIPADVTAGDYPLTLLLSSQLPKMEGTTVVQTQVVIGAHLIITVVGNELTQKLRVSDFTTLGGIPLDFGPLHLVLYDSFDIIPILVRVENDGSTMIEPQGVLTLTSPLFPKAQFTILSQSVLTNSARRLLIQSTQNSNLSGFSPNPVSLSLSHGIYFGAYTLGLHLRVNAAAPDLSLTTNFIALPYKIGFLSAVVYTVLYLVKKHKVRHHRHK